MFAKLLKYDLRAILKYWWIAAVSSAVLSVAGGVCVRILNVDSEQFAIAQIFAVLGLIVVIMGLGIFVVLNEVLILIRFYKHFFSDEGYLTFTLPVRKTSLLNSKLLSAMIFVVMTLAVVTADIFVILTIGIPEYIFAPEFLEQIAELLSLFVKEGLLYNLLILAEIFIIVAMLEAVSLMFVFICITVAAVIARKHKVLAAIGIYYAATSALSFLTQIMLFTNRFYRIIELIDRLPEAQLQTASALILLGVIGVLGIVFCAMYLLEMYMLDRRLNLE